MYIMNNTRKKLVNTNVLETIEVDSIYEDGEVVYRVVASVHNGYISLAKYDTEEEAKESLRKIADTMCSGVKVMRVE